MSAARLSDRRNPTGRPFPAGPRTVDCGRPFPYNSRVPITFRFTYPIHRTMAFEREYHPNLRLNLVEKKQILCHAVTIWMLEDGRPIGETYGIPLDGRFEMPEGCSRDPQAIYCYSNTILGEHKNQGYGRILKAFFIGHVAHSFRRIYGHARPGPSQKLNASFGARFLRIHKNWYRTGEDYRLYVLPLAKPAAD